MEYYVIKEKDTRGSWFNVYINGQCVDGFRDPSDAELFGRWLSVGGSTRVEEYIHHVSSEDHNPE